MSITKGQSTVLIAILRQANMAKLAKMAKIAAMEWHNMAINMVNLDVYAKIRKNVDHL